MRMRVIAGFSLLCGLGVAVWFLSDPALPPPPFAGDLTGLGRRGGRAVTRVDFAAGQMKETLRGGELHVVAVPDRDDVQTGLMLGRAIPPEKRVIGYRYATPDAAAEAAAKARADAGEPLTYAELFPGQFFVSDAARQSDTAVMAFAAQRGIDFADVSQIAVQRGDRFVILPLESGVTFSIRIPVCGDGVADDGEQCDDGNQDDGDGCSNLCRIQTHLSCVNDACVQIEGAGSDTCSSTAECLPTYDATVTLVPPPLITSPLRETEFVIRVGASTPQTGLAVTFTMESLYHYHYELWEPGPDCQEVAGFDEKTVRCPLPSVGPSETRSFAFRIQPAFFPNCSVAGNSIAVTAVLSQANGSRAGAPRTLSLPFDCMTTAELTNIRAADAGTVPVADCGVSRLGNGVSDFYFVPSWVEDRTAGKAHIFGVLTGNASGHFSYDHAAGTIDFEVLAAGGRSFVRDAVWDAGQNLAYLFVQRFAATTNAFEGETIDVYDPGSNTVTLSVPAVDMRYMGYAGTPLRRPVMKDGKAYFFPVYFFNSQPTYLIEEFDPSSGTVAEVGRSALPPDTSGYPSVTDVYRSGWRQCFARSAKVPLQ